MKNFFLVSYIKNKTVRTLLFLLGILCLFAVIKYEIENLNIFYIPQLILTFYAPLIFVCLIKFVVSLFTDKHKRAKYLFVSYIENKGIRRLLFVLALILGLSVFALCISEINVFISLLFSIFIFYLPFILVCYLKWIFMARKQKITYKRNILKVSYIKNIALRRIVFTISFIMAITFFFSVASGFTTNTGYRSPDSLTQLVILGITISLFYIPAIAISALKWIITGFIQSHHKK